jgi:hypothetical protein
MMPRWLALFVTFVGLVITCSAQETGAELMARVRNGGWLEASRYQRNAAGVLESWSFSHTTSADHGEWLPLLGNDGDRVLHLENLGAFGYLALFCHGDGDLLAMTDVALHFGALGIGTTDVDLRQFLARPAPSFDGSLGRAELLDRLLAIDCLVQRRCRGALAELTMLAKDATIPAVLRDAAARALAGRRGETASITRLRLDPATIALPAAFDGCVLVDHARLPDMRWLTPLARRIGALITARVTEMAGGDVTPVALNGAQRYCDAPSVAPFWLAHQLGNARLDHSLVTVTARADPRMPMALTWNAVGAIEAERWAEAKLPDGAARNNPLLGGSLTVAATSLYASTDGSAGKPRPAQAAKLLAANTSDDDTRNDTAAVRAIVPANSKLWPVLVAFGLPPANGGEVRMTFGDPATIVIDVTARDEDAAEEWLAKGTALLAKSVAEIRAGAPPGMQENRDLHALLDAVAAAKCRVAERRLLATIEVRAFTSARLAALLEAVVLASY